MRGSSSEKGCGLGKELARSLAVLGALGREVSSSGCSSQGGWAGGASILGPRTSH